MANLDSIDLSISKGTLNEIDGSILDGQDVISPAPSKAVWAGSGVSAIWKTAASWP